MIRLRGKLSKTSLDTNNSTKQLTTTTKNNENNNNNNNNNSSNNYSYIVDRKNSRTAVGNGIILMYNNEDTNGKQLKNRVSILHKTLLFNSSQYNHHPLLLLLLLFIGLLVFCIFSITFVVSYFPITTTTVLSSIYSIVLWICDYNNDELDITTTTSLIEFCTNNDHYSSSNPTKTAPTNHLFTIDNYCSKHNNNNKKQQHTMKSKENQQHQDDENDGIDNEPTILIIGGTDGSGTRAITNILRDYLGTTIIYDDPITFDIHGHILFHHTGWPSLVNYIINYTHSGNYEYTTLPTTVQQVLQYELYNFKNYYERRSKSELYKRKQNTYVRSLLSNSLTTDNNSKNSNNDNTTSIGIGTNNNTNTAIPSEHGGTIRNSNNKNQNHHQHHRHHHHYKPEWIIPSNYKSNAIHVLYGFKAPVSMMLLPLFVQMYGTSLSSTTTTSTTTTNKKKNKTYKRRKIKFIHVIRDGRDIALSNNKAPVEKFYNTYYGKIINNSIVEQQQQRRTELYKQYDIYLQSLLLHANTTATPPPPPPSQSWLKNNTTNITNSTMVMMDNITFVNSILAIDLWNDWNKDVYDYCKNHTNDIDYIVIRTEDLVSTNVSIQYSTITKLAYFVGTTQLTNNNICQYSKDQILSTKDLGVSFKTYDKKTEQLPTQQQQQKEKQILSKSERRRMEQDNTLQTQLETDVHFHKNGFGVRRKKSQKVMNDNNTTNGRLLQKQPEHQQQEQQYDHVVPIHERYGKWKSILQNNNNNNKILSQLLHTHGHDTLQLFGYEPYRIIESDMYYSDSYNVCF